jgi:hypothetical protein
LTPSARSANLIAGDGTKNGFPAPNKEPSKNQNDYLTGKAPYRFESHYLLDQRSRSLLQTAASPSTTTQGLPPEAMIVDTNIAISVRTFYPLQGQPASWIAPMNILPREKRVEAISALCEGVSVRATERLTGVNRGTILSLSVRVGDGCATLHDAMMRGLHVSRIELDEAWSFVAKKQRHLKPSDPADFGDQYVFLALAGASKAIISFRVGKRNGENCRAFLADLRARVLGAAEISSDAFPAYPDAVERAFGSECRFGTIEKHYAVEQAVEAARRYFFGDCSGGKHD